MQRSQFFIFEYSRVGEQIFSATSVVPVTIFDIICNIIYLVNKYNFPPLEAYFCNPILKYTNQSIAFRKQRLLKFN